MGKPKELKCQCDGTIKASTCLTNGFHADCMRCQDCGEVLYTAEQAGELLRLRESRRAGSIYASNQGTLRCTNEQAMKYLADYKAFISKKYKLHKVLLFGSRARNDHLLSSDVDLIVVSDDFAGTPFMKRCGDLLEGWDGPVDLEILGYTRREFNRMRKRLGIVAQAVKDGVEI